MEPDDLASTLKAIKRSTEISKNQVKKRPLNKKERL